MSKCQIYKIAINSLNGFSFRKNLEGEKEVSTDGGATWENFTSGASLLWTNPNPKVAFPEQTITIDGSKYDYYIVFGTPSRTQNEMVGNTIFKKGSTITNGFGGSSGTAVYTREIKNTTDNSITFTGAKVNSAGSINNNFAIPLYVYGINIDKLDFLI